MGKSSKPVIGFWYGMGLHMGLCVGPIDALRQIVAGGKQAWSGSQTASGDITISRRYLFGGEKKEGGIDGTATVLMGEQTQMPNAYLISQLGTPMPAFRGLCTVLFRGLVGAMNPYLKAWAFKVSKWTVGWRTEVWQPDLCKIGEGANPAHILYRAVTDPITGLGRDPSAMDLDRMLVAAQTLYDEGLGLCIKWSRSDVMGNFVSMICNHVGGIWVDDPTTGKEYLKLFRADYDIDTVPVLDESNIIDLVSYEQASLFGSVNEVVVTYRDVVTNKDANTPAVQNLANVQAQGRVVNQTTSYPAIWNGDLAARLALRDLQATSSLPARGKAKIKASVSVRKGDVLALSWARLSLVKMPIRVLEIERGTETDKAVTITFAQDVYALPAQTYVVVQPSLWTAPNTTPAPISEQVLLEASYRDLAAYMRPADLAALDATACYVGAVAAKPPCVAYDYSIASRIGSSGDFITAGAGIFAPTALLGAAMLAEAGPTAVMLIDGVDLNLVQLGTEVLVDDELMRVDVLDPVALTAVLARGCVDTTPAAHAANARIWFTDGYTGVDPTEYITGETVQSKLLTRTADGVLDQSLATTLSVLLNERQARPYPPGNLTINGVAYPASVIEPLAIAWSHRDRITQADQLIDTTQGDIGPEDGTTYTVRVYLNGVLDSTTAGIAGTTAAPAVSGYGPLGVEIDSVVAGLSSITPMTASFTYIQELNIVTPSPINLTSGTAGALQLAATGGTPPDTWTSGALPSGITMDSGGLLTYDGTTASGSYSVAFTLEDSGVPPQSKQKVITISVSGGTFDPSANFSGGVNGAWYDPSDLSMMFQDTAGTVAVTAVGQKVALFKDKSGNGYDLTQATSAARPTLEQDASSNYYLQFSGGQCLQIANTNALYLGTHSLVAVVAAQFASGASDQAIFARSLAAAAAGRYGLLRDSGGVGLESLYGLNSSGVNTAGGADSSTTVRVLTQIVDRVAGTNTLRSNAATFGAAAPFTADSGTNFTNAERFLLGAYNNSTDTGQVDYFSGAVYGLVLRLAPTVDDTLRDETETWMAAKCGVTL